jgi:glucans biosynthesis protein
VTSKQPLELEYQVLWQKDLETKPPQSYVVQTRRGTGYQRTPDKAAIGFMSISKVLR